MLEHLPDDAAAMAELARVLRPGGLLAVSVPRYGPEVVNWALSERYHNVDGGHVRIYRRRQLKERFEAAGLELVATHHAHALHSPYWWLRCLVGVDNDRCAAVRAYHGLLVWDITAATPFTRVPERILNPVLGKSLVAYLRHIERDDRPLARLGAGRIAETVESIRAVQLRNGMIPWFGGGHGDPWNHVEAAMALTVGGAVAEAERAFEWLMATQRPDGAWHTYYLADGQVEEPRLDTNVCAYVATGVWHHFLSTGDAGHLEEPLGDGREGHRLRTRLAASRRRARLVRRPRRDAGALRPVVRVVLGLPQPPLCHRLCPRARSRAA